MMVDVRAERDLPCCEIQHTVAVEDYLKALFHLSVEGERVSTSTVAARLGVAAPSASVMLRRLEASELVEHPRPRQVELTDHGRRHALRIVRRHRLLETFLARALDVPWDEVHAEAEVLEHALSERLEDRIDALLGYPTHDPHGDPIPPKDGAHDEAWGTPLAAAAAGDRFRVERVCDRDSAALRHLADLGLVPGAELAVEGRDPFGGPLWVAVGGRRRPLGLGLLPLLHGTVLDQETRP